MAKPFTLQPLVQLAHKKNDEATRRLGQLNHQLQQAQSRLEALLQYRKDYQQRFEEITQSGMRQAELQNFQNFIRRLDEAIQQQRGVANKAAAQLDAGRNDVMETQRRMKSFDTLAQRHEESEKIQESKLEQRLQDEFAGRSARMKMTRETDSN